MTIQAWGIVLNAGILALPIIGGFWLRNIVNQQLAAKDATIESREAEISRLKAETAPAIARAYADMRTHADKMTEDASNLNLHLQELHFERRLHPVDELIAGADGITLAVAEMATAVEPYILGQRISEEQLPALMSSIIGALRRMVNEAAAKTNEAKKLVDATKNKP